MKLFRPTVLAASLVIIFSGCSGLKFTSSFDDSFTEPLSSATLADRTTLSVYYADTAAEQAQGLANVETLGTNEGMLFSYVQNPSTPSFWMKGVEYPIDIIWLNGNQIIGLTKNVQPELAATPLSDYTLYLAPAQVTGVLEVPADFAFLHALRVGDSFTYTLPE